ncbi:hypothetical protein [Lysinibacillus parviboronicapiens]|uniref:Uncharacterized protein n=1 Tax=Lysinibacillus parviboronicapiens TaxID=436516 RepID=A0ABV2PNX5_9BACI|nr:hypothetical protein [Lysinibacillus parviboronicapiens]
MYTVSNLKLLIDKQEEIDAIYKNCEDLKKTTVSPKMTSEVDKFLDAVNKRLVESGFTVTLTQTGLIAKYKEATVNVDKHSKDLEECFFINFNNFAEDRLSIILDIKHNKNAQTNSNYMDGFSEFLEQMSDKLNYAKNLQDACRVANVIYRTQNNVTFYSAEEVVNYYFK